MTKSKKHICKEPTRCICCLSSMEPEDKCPLHGCGYIPRCGCGRWMKWKIKKKNE